MYYLILDISPSKLMDLIDNVEAKIVCPNKSVLEAYVQKYAGTLETFRNQMCKLGWEVIPKPRTRRVGWEVKSSKRFQLSTGEYRKYVCQIGTHGRLKSGYNPHKLTFLKFDKISPNGLYYTFCELDNMVYGLPPKLKERTSHPHFLKEHHPFRKELEAWVIDQMDLLIITPPDKANQPMWKN